MNITRLLSPFEQFLLFLQAEMEEPQSWGRFHLLTLGLMCCAIAVLYTRRKQHCETQLKFVLGMYSMVALTTELLKQLSWTFNYNLATQVVLWDYEWYSFPYQLCSTPMYVCLACFLMKKCRLRDSLLSYVAYITILGSIATIFMPDSCFVHDILVNIHTTHLHYGSFVVSVYLLMSGEVKLEREALLRGIFVFLAMVTSAFALNELVYWSGILEGETFNMFYISRHFISELPVFCDIQQAVPYPIFVAAYIVALSLGGLIIYEIARGIQYVYGKIESRTRSHRLPLHM